MCRTPLQAKYTIPQRDGQEWTVRKHNTYLCRIVINSHMCISLKNQEFKNNNNTDTCDTTH